MKLQSFTKVFASFVFLASINASAIVTTTWLDQAQTPVLSSAMKTQSDEFFKRYENEIPDRNAPGAAKSFYLKFTKQPDDVISEIRKIWSTTYEQGARDKLVIEEFDRLKKNLRDRGYEPSQQLYWAPPNQVVIFYKSDLGPEFQKGLNGDPDHYRHTMHFEQWLNYQPKGLLLSGGTNYPRLVLSGDIFFACLKQFDDCYIVNAQFTEAGIRWETVPAPRGGNSSSGGGR